MAVIIIVMVVTLAELGQEIRSPDHMLLFSVENTTKYTSGTMFNGKEV